MTETETTWEHPAAPGSRRAGAENAAAQAEPAALHVAAHQAELTAQAPGLTAVPVTGSVRSQRPWDGVWRTMVLQPGQARQLLPQDPQRCRAVLIAIDSPVVICDSKELASNPDNISAASSLVEPANPAAGAIFTYTNTTGVTQSLLAVACKLVTSAVVANRFLQLKIFDSSGNTVAQVGGSGAIPASTTVNATWVGGISTIATGTAGGTTSGIPNVPIQPGWQIQINVSGIDVADQLSAIVLNFAQAVPGTVFAQGMLLPANIALAVENRGLAWAVNPGPATARVSVLTERYETPESHPDR
jgi:hypothetical protein